MATCVGERWAFPIDTVLLGVQLVAVTGVLFELSQFETSEKAARLRALGVDPLRGLAMNLAFCAVGSALFARMLWRSR